MNLKQKISPQECEDYISQQYKFYYPLLRKIVIEITRDINTVDDIINDTWVNLLGKENLLKSLDPYKRTAYITTSCKRSAIKFSKSIFKRNSMIETLDSCDQAMPYVLGVEDILDLKEDLIKVSESFYKLKSTDQLLLRLRYGLQMSESEISDVTSISKRNVRVYMYRARQRLIKLIRSSEGGVN